MTHSDRGCCVGFGCLLLLQLCFGYLGGTRLPRRLAALLALQWLAWREAFSVHIPTNGQSTPLSCARQSRRMLDLATSPRSVCCVLFRGPSLERCSGAKGKGGPSVAHDTLSSTVIRGDPRGVSQFQRNGAVQDGDPARWRRCSLAARRWLSCCMGTGWATLVKTRGRYKT